MMPMATGTSTPKSDRSSGASTTHRTRSNNAREQVLDAFERILIRSGERAATLDAVAAQAKVSKGGLLYHFGSKNALVQGLIERLRTYMRRDFEAMAAAPEGASVYYITPPPMPALP